MKIPQLTNNFESFWNENKEDFKEANINKLTAKLIYDKGFEDARV